MDEDFSNNPLNGKHPRVIEILRILNRNYKSSYACVKDIYDFLEANDGTTKRIINDFRRTGILQPVKNNSFFKKDRTGLVFNQKIAVALYEETIYSKTGMELGMGDVFG